MKVRWLLIGCLMAVLACESGPERAFDDPDEYVRYGNAYLRRETPRFMQAAKQFKYALDLDADHFDALIGLGDALMFRAKALSVAKSKREEASSGNQQGDREPSGPQASPPSPADGQVPGEGRPRPRDQEQGKSLEERISSLLGQATTAYKKARKTRPESAIPYYKYARLIYMFRDRDPQEVTRSRRLLNEALDRATEQNNPQLRAKVLFYLGNATLYIEQLKPAGEQDYSEVTSYFNRYLDIFDERDIQAPRRAEVENLLMQIEDYQEEQNESGSNP
jgi:cytochrome c-type biogenesis protein CcmH/NrfG